MPPKVALLLCCVGCAGFLPSAPPVEHNHDRFTGRDTTSVDFRFSRTYASPDGEGRFVYQDGAGVELVATFENNMRYVDCHDLHASINGQPAELGAVAYAPSWTLGRAIEEIRAALPRPTLIAMRGAAAVELRLCQDEKALSAYELNGLKAFLADVLPRMPAEAP